MAQFDRPIPFRPSACVKGFGCRPLTGRATHSVGRRPKASKGGNRDGGTYGCAAGSMGIWPQRLKTRGVDEAKDGVEGRLEIGGWTFFWGAHALCTMKVSATSEAELCDLGERQAGGSMTVETANSIAALRCGPWS